MPEAKPSVILFNVMCDIVVNILIKVGLGADNGNIV